MTLTRLGTIALVTVVVGLVVYGLVTEHNHRRELGELRERLATRDKTVEVQKNVYERLAVEHRDLEKLLDDSYAEDEALRKQVKQAREDVLSVDRLTVRWRHPYEGQATAHQTEERPISTPGRDGTPEHVRSRVDFERDFGYIAVSGHTLTDPAEAFVSVRQARPLRLALALTQGKDRAWHTYVTSSEENVGVDITVASVDPLVLSPRWYEKLSVDTSLGIGGQNFVGGVGLSYRVGKFDVGPAVWLTGGDTVSRLYGASLSWRPFQRD